jgi:hypothetical protein
MKRAPDQEEVPTLTFTTDALPGKVRNTVACKQVEGEESSDPMTRRHRSLNQHFACQS